MEDFKSESDPGAGRRVAISGSPYRVSARPAPTDTYSTRADGPGLTRSRVAARARFTVRCRDRFQVINPNLHPKP